jgi:hypothetical protein
MLKKSDWTHKQRIRFRYRNSRKIIRILPEDDSTERKHVARKKNIEVEVVLRLTISQSVCLGIEHPCWTCDQILLPLGMLLFEICGLVCIGHPLWREDGSAICSVITQWSELRRTRNHTLLSHLRLPQPGGPGSLFISPRNRVAQLYPRALGSLYVVSYDSQGYGGGILTLALPGGTGPCVYSLQE